MYLSMQKIANLFKGKQGMHVAVVCTTGILSACSYSAWSYIQSPTKFYRTLEWCTLWKNRSKARCQINAQANSLTDQDTASKKKKEPKIVDGSPANELRIILLGATGSGKSSAGNLFLNKKELFKTSCYPKSETRESTVKTFTREINSKTYTIRIIDTPAYLDTGLTEEAVNGEIKKAIAFSAPGPHAFLLCIPATSITEYYTNVIEPYKKYFKDISDFTFVTITRYDQLKSKSRTEMKKYIDIKNEEAVKIRKQTEEKDKPNLKTCERCENLQACQTCKVREACKTCKYLKTCERCKTLKTNERCRDIIQEIFSKTLEADTSPKDMQQKIDTLAKLTKDIKNDIIILQKDEQMDNTDVLIEAIIYSMKQRKNKFASCKLSKHAENKLQDTITNINKLPTIMKVSRENIILIPDFSKHFSQNCKVGE